MRTMESHGAWIPVRPSMTRRANVKACQEADNRCLAKGASRKSPVRVSRMGLRGVPGKQGNEDLIQAKWRIDVAMATGMDGAAMQGTGKATQGDLRAARAGAVDGPVDPACAFRRRHRSEIGRAHV